MPGKISELKNKPMAIIAIGIILLATLCAVFAYSLAPDNSEHANVMILELAAKSAGFEKDLLYLPKKQQQPPKSAWEQIWTGAVMNYEVVPINKYGTKGNTFWAAHYIDEGMQDTLYFKTTDLRAPIIKHRTFYLGTDPYGRDILSRLLIGARVSIAVGFISVLLSLCIGIVLGSIAGYYGGITDNIVMWLINLLWAIPTLLLVFAITLTLGKGFWEIFIAIGLTMWVGAARLIRGQVMVIKQMDYISAARALGYGDMRIMFRHILPNIAGPLMVIAANNFAAAILTESGLSFLGIGVQAPQPSWGLMIKEHYNFLLSERPMLALIPGFAIMMLVFAFNILGNALRDLFDVNA